MQRLQRAARHVCANEPEAPAASAAPAAELQAPPPPVLLSDAQVRRFCAQNFLVLEPSTLDSDFHRGLFEQLEAVHAAGGGIPGNGAILEAVPGLQRVYDDPTIRGGVESLVGPGAIMHFHRHCHRREGDGGGGGGQAWHKDDYYYETPVRHKAAFRWIFALYYPTDTTLAMGPTAILPGHAAHCLLSSCDPEQASEAEKPFVVPAGSVALIHFDSWHRAMPIYEGVRHMLKFHFVRMVEPCLIGPSWNTQEEEEEEVVQEEGQEEDWPESEASAATYEWLCGRDVTPSHTMLQPDGGGGDGVVDLTAVERTVAAIHNGREPDRVAAALAAGAAAADRDRPESSHIIELLMTWLRSQEGGVTAAKAIHDAGGQFSTSEDDGAPRRSKACNPAGTNPADLDVTHALAAAGAAAVKPLLAALEQQQQLHGDDEQGEEEEETEEEEEEGAWAVACSAAAVLGNANALQQHDDQDGNSEEGMALQVCQALARCVLRPSSHRWVRRNAVESLGTAAQGLYDAATRAEVAKALVRAIDHPGQSEGEERAAQRSEEEAAESEDQYDTDCIVRAHAVLSLARLANAWQHQGRRSGMEGLAMAAPLLTAMVKGEDADSQNGHRLSGTMADYARHALERLEGWV
jgi:hypothetical protein